jgi:ABC-type multidrug transport system ATPase subunit
MYVLATVMGPSGAGKSTILDIISKRTHATHGTVSIAAQTSILSAADSRTIQVTVNGTEDFDMRSLGAYVEQSDALLGVLSVRETINFAARLR